VHGSGARAGTLHTPGAISSKEMLLTDSHHNAFPRIAITKIILGPLPAHGPARGKLREQRENRVRAKTMEAGIQVSGESLSP
jgi:hypothetical protein